MKSPSDPLRPKRPLITRRRAIKLIAAGASASLLDGFWFEPGHLTVTRQDLPIRKLPPGLDGLRIGHMSDFHFRPGDDDALLEKVIARVRAEKLDLVALTGDYLSLDPKVVAPLLDHLKNLTAAHGVFAVMGNHDGWRGSRSVIKRQFDTAGLSFLINENSQLSIHGEKLAIAGTDFVWRGKPDLARTLKGISPSTPVIAMVHEPDFFDTMAHHRDIQLQLSGHTHGGQCRVPLIGYAPRKIPLGKNYTYGHFTRGNSNLFVSRGVGTVGIRVRFACPPELAVLTLKSA